MTDENTPPNPSPDDLPTQRLPQPADDAPTQRLPQSANDAPTQRLPQPSGLEVPASEPPVAPPGAPTTGGAVPPRRGRGLLVGLIVAGVLIVALIGVIVWLVIRPVSAPVAAPTDAGSSAAPSVVESPSATATQPGDDSSGSGSGSGGGSGGGSGSGGDSDPSTPPTADGAPVFTSFSIPNATCPAGAATGTSTVTIQYASDGATQAFFGINVVNAAEAPTAGPLPVTGPFSFDYQCSDHDQLWTMTLTDGAGGTTNKSVRIYQNDAAAQG